MILKLKKHSAFLFQSYLVDLQIDGTERYRWLEYILVSDFASFVHEETTLFNDPIFSKDAVLEYVQTPEKKHDKKRNMEVLPEKGEIMIFMIVTHFYSLIYRKGVSGCFITNCVVVVFV